MPVDYKLKTLRRLFGVKNMFQRPKPPVPRADLEESTGGIGEFEDDQDEWASDLEDRGGGRHGRGFKGDGGVPNPYFANEPPKAVMGKSVSGLLYIVNLYEKQKMRVYYGAIRDGMFRRYAEKAWNSRYNSDAELLRSLEVRLDSVLYRTGFVQSPAQARQWITHNHVLVNGEPLNIRSARITPGDAIAIHDEFVEQALTAAQAAAEFRGKVGCGASWIPSNPTSTGMIPWMEIDRRGLTAALVREPFNHEVRELQNAALFPFVRNSHLNPYAAMRAYK